MTVDGIPDTTGISATPITTINVFGGKRARNKIEIDSSVTIPSVISGGQGYRNKLTGGSVETREHGWFGHTTLVGGTGRNQLIGLAGLVKFKPTRSTNLIFAGMPKKRTSDLNPTPPGERSTGWSADDSCRFTSSEPGMTELPIDAALPQILDALHRRSVVVVAPPGSGKTTRVPPAIVRSVLLSIENPTVVVLEPRRVRRTRRGGQNRGRTRVVPRRQRSAIRSDLNGGLRGTPGSAF